MKLRNSDRAALVNELHVLVGRDLKAMNLGPVEIAHFWNAIGKVQEAQHWKSWRFGVRAGRMRAATPLTELVQPKFVETLMMVSVIGSVFASIMRAGRKGVAAPEPHERIEEAVQS